MASITAADVAQFYERADASKAPNDSVRCAACQNVIQTGDAYSPYVKTARADALRNLPDLIAVCAPCTYLAMITRTTP